MMKQLVVAALLLAAAAPRALAAETKIGGVAITLPVPAGFCDVPADSTPAGKIVAQFREILAKSGNTLLGLAADCHEVAQINGGKRRVLANYVSYQTGTAAADDPHPSQTVAESCTQLRAEGQKLTANAEADIKKRTAEVTKDLKINETAFLGVLAEDAGACYAGLLQRFQTAGVAKTQLRVFAITTVKDKSVFVYRYADYANANTVADQLAKVKVTTAAMLAANR